MNIARPAIFLAFPAIAPLVAFPVQAAPAAVTTRGALTSSASTPVAAATLTFDVTARVGSSSQAGLDQTIQAKVLLRGGRARVESRSGGAPAVVLYAPPYIYRLLPDSKAGVRWKVNARQPSNYAGFDPQQLMREPAKIKGALLRGGAKLVGRSTLGGSPVEIYAGRNFGAPGQNAKVWLRASDALPLRLEASGGQFKIVASWRNYARPRLSAALFSSPAGYRVRTLASAPPFSAL